MGRAEVMSMLQKWLLQKSTQAGELGTMSGREILGGLAEKTGQGIMAGAGAVKANPLAAGVGGVAGIGAGLSMGKNSSDEEEEEELLRQYGLR